MGIKLHRTKIIYELLEEFFNPIYIGTELKVNDVLYKPDFHQVRVVEVTVDKVQETDRDIWYTFSEHYIQTPYSEFNDGRFNEFSLCPFDGGDALKLYQTKEAAERAMIYSILSSSKDEIPHYLNVYNHYAEEFVEEYPERVL